MIDWTYENMYAEYAPFREKYPTKEEYQAKFESDPKMQEWVYDNFAAEFEPFAKKYPVFEEFAGKMDLTTIATPVKTHAKKLLRQKYAGTDENWEKWTANPQASIATLNKMKARVTEATPEASKQRANLDNMIQIMESFVEIGEATGGMESTNKYTNIVLPEARYFVERVEPGIGVGLQEALLPEFSEFAKEDKSLFSKGLGAAKDIFTLPARALRAGLEEWAPGQSEETQIPYSARMARPTEYKSTAAQTMDELLSLQPILNVGARKLASKAPTIMQPIGQALGLTPTTTGVVTTRAKGLPTIAPLKSALAAGIKSAPEVGFEAAYQAQRDDGAPGAVLAGGLIPSMIGGAASPAFRHSKYVQSEAPGAGLARKLTGGTDLQREIAEGSFEKDLQKAGMGIDPKDLLTTKSVERLRGGVESAKQDIKQTALQRKETYDNVIAANPNINAEMGKETLVSMLKSAGHDPAVYDRKVQAFNKVSTGTPLKTYEQLVNRMMSRIKRSDMPIAEKARFAKNINHANSPKRLMEINSELVPVLGGDPLSVILDAKEMIKKRTALRRFGQGEDAGSAAQKAYASAEADVKQSMRKTLAGVEGGEDVLKNYEDIAIQSEIVGDIEDILDKNARTTDRYFNQLAMARMKPGTKTSELKSHLDVLDKIEGGSEVISSAIIRRMKETPNYLAKIAEQEGFDVTDMLASKQALDLFNASFKAFIRQRPEATAKAFFREYFADRDPTKGGGMQIYNIPQTQTVSDATRTLSGN